ncbi:hypothetical protein ASG87_16605 [Frateuria sp. Soil773]|uniref:hypothetical protein n=1 Tax=Frateuria sp. Soil773 TaxID=1736407 RepID=UPI0007019FB7|nr:hypothetical protein [Frateuria sp. Soil773]KRE96607.1 hypothetical protein ASG87_16605 [Frateuria sp. Soil773]
MPFQPFRPLFPIAVLAAAIAPTSRAMPPAASTTTVRSAPASLDVEARYDAATRKLAVRYRLHNTGTEPLAVFDRGDSMQLRTHQLEPGKPAPPLQADDDGGLTFSHRAMPLRKPPPIVPHIPLAGRLDAGASRADTFTVDVPPGVGRVRYCLGVAPFPAEGFRPATGAGDGVWQASYRIVDQQTLLCTPWLDLATARFADPQA